MKLNDLSQSDLARLSGVSRQAVSYWFRSGACGGSANGQIPVKVKALSGLSAGLRLSADQLIKPLPDIESGSAGLTLKTRFLWDGLYPSLNEFAIALVKGEKPALARLAEASGMFEAAQIAGSQVWRRFQAYKRFIHPMRRSECELVWQTQKDLALI